MNPSGTNRAGARGPSSREKILDVAEALFARRGYAGVGLREVALTVGLGKSSLFHHFPNKGHLYAEVLGRVLERIRDRLDPVLENEETPPPRKLEECLDALVDSLAEHPTSARLLLRALFEEDDVSADAREETEAVERLLGQVLGAIRRLLQQGVDGGWFRPVSVPHTMQTLIGATVYHFASGELGDEMLGRPLFSAEAVRTCKDELRELLRSGLVAER